MSDWTKAIEEGNKLADEMTVEQAKVVVAKAKADAILAKAKADVEAAKNKEEDDLIDIPNWPAPPNEEAFSGLAGEFVNLWEPHTEADRVALLGQFLAVAGHAVGHGPYFATGGDDHHTNIYVALTGVTSTGRKGQSFGCVKKTFDLVAPIPFPVPFGTSSDSYTIPATRSRSGLSSGEGLIKAVSDRKMGRDKKGQEIVINEGETDKRMLVFEPEMAGILRRMGREGNTVSEELRKAWDDHPLGTMTVESLRATGAHISVVTHVTRADLSLYLNDVSISNGFANRFVFLASKRIRLLSNPGRPNQTKLNDFARKLSIAIHAASKIGQMHRSVNANLLWKELYEKLEAPRTGRLHNSVVRRGSPYVVRLSMIYALLDTPIVDPYPNNPQKLLTRQPYVIEEKHLRAAYALWQYAERTSKFVFGDSLGDKTAEKIEKLLIASGDSGLMTHEIRAKIGNKKGVSDALRLLVELEKIRVEPCTVNNSPGQKWFIIR